MGHGTGGYMGHGRPQYLTTTTTTTAMPRSCASMPLHRTASVMPSPGWPRPRHLDLQLDDRSYPNPNPALTLICSCIVEAISSMAGASFTVACTEM